MSYTNRAKEKIHAVQAKANTKAAKMIWGAVMKRKKHPNPKDTIVVTSPKVLDPGDFQDLSPFDIWESRFPVTLNYVFAPNKQPDFQKMIAALEQLLVKYPALGGRFKVEDTNRVIVRYAPQPEVKVYVCPPEADDYDEWTKGLFDDKLVSSVSCGLPIMQGERLFQARLTPIEGVPGRTVLSVAVNHGLVDMQSLAQLVGDWARLTRGEDVELPYERQRANLIRSGGSVSDGGASSDSDSSELEFDQKRVEEMGWVDSPFVPLMAQNGMDLLVSQPKSRAFTFAPDDVASLKKLVMEGKAWSTFQSKGHRLSTHDVLTALLWKALAQAHPYHPEEKWDLIVVVNWRGRTDLVSSDYFGNATTGPHTSRTMQQVLNEMDFSECALCVRELSTVNKDDVEHIVNFQNSLMNSSDETKTKTKVLDNFVNVGAYNVANGCGLYISNFSKFDLYDADFGTGRPDLVRFPQPPLPGYCYGYSAKEGRDITMIVTMSGEDSDRLERLNCEMGQAVLTEMPPQIERPVSQMDSMKEMVKEHYIPGLKTLLQNILRKRLNE